MLARDGVQTGLAQYAPDPSTLGYVVGTKVPLPGGGQAEKGAGRRIHLPDGARRTLACHRNALKAKGLGAA